MSDLKTTIISGMNNGENVLNELAIAKKIGRDITENPNATLSKINQYHPKMMNLEITEIEELGEFAKCFRFAYKNGVLPVFEAGQYLNFFVEIDGVRTSRPYSISSSPKQRAYFEIIIARQQSGFVSDYFLDKVKVGDCFEVNGPAGVFRYNPVFHSKHQVFLAGGSGITPFLSMSREILLSGLDRTVDLIYGSRNENLAIAHKELSEFSEQHDNFNYHLVVSDDANCTKYRKGFIDENCIRDLIKEPEKATYYICGPEIMNKFCAKILTEMKIPSQHIRREVFGAKPDIQNSENWPKEFTGKEMFTITIGSKKIPAVSGENVLTALERAGISVNVCCRSGGCSFCRAKLLSGKVFKAEGAKNRYADKLFGYIHTCKSYPLSDLSLII